MDNKSDTTRSMERKANTIKRLVIALLKVFRICRGKKHKSAEIEPAPAQKTQTIALNIQYEFIYWYSQYLSGSPSESLLLFTYPLPCICTNLPALQFGISVIFLYAGTKDWADFNNFSVGDGTLTGTRTASHSNSGRGFSWCNGKTTKIRDLAYVLFA